MKTLLRSTFMYDKGDNPDLQLRNHLMLAGSGLGFEVQADDVIWNFNQQFVRRHSHVPDYSTLVQHFKLTKQDEVLDRLDVVANLQGITQGDFEARLENKAEERRIRRVSDVLKEAAGILTTGMTIQTKGEEDESFHGPLDALRYIRDQSADIVAPTLGANLSGEVTRDGAAVAEEYERVEADPLAGIGQHTGLPQMDNVLNGAKRHELWIHAAFTGGLKSTFIFNWAYNQAVYYRHDSLIFSLEMPYQQVRRIIYSIHSAHEKFKSIRYKLGLQADETSTVGLSYTHVRDGRLHEWHPNARKFLFDYVIPDLNDKNNKYGRVHIEVADPDKSDFTVADLRQRAELLYSERPFSTVFVDHIGLMAPRKWVSSTTERLNEVVRDLKRMAMSFNRGAGIAMVGLFQIGREGYKRVTKGRKAGQRAEYNLTDLSYSNETERSGDVVTASWVDDELRKQNRVEYFCLKSRDQGLFETFLARVEFGCRRIVFCYDVPQVPTPSDGDKKATQAGIEAAANKLNE